MNEVAFQGSTLIKIVVACCQPSARRAEVASMVQKGTVLRVRTCLEIDIQEIHPVGTGELFLQFHS